MENLKVSKELASAVLKSNIYKVSLNNATNCIFYDEEIKDIFYERNMNIYEFAFKCKEWAFNKMYFLSSGKDTSGGWCLIRDINKCFVNDENPYTEIEAIIEACTYILDNLSNK